MSLNREDTVAEYLTTVTVTTDTVYRHNMTIRNQLRPKSRPCRSYNVYCSKTEAKVLSRPVLSLVWYRAAGRLRVTQRSEIQLGQGQTEVRNPDRVRLRQTAEIQKG